MTDADVFRIIVSEFGYKKEPGPIVLFVINKNSEICLYFIVLPLGLAISLRVESSGEPSFDLKEVS